MFLAHCNILNPHEVLCEIEFIMELGKQALQTRAFHLDRKPWVFFCPRFFSSVINFDPFIDWLSERVIERRKKILTWHLKQSNIPCEYPFIRVMCSTERGQEIICHKSGPNGMGFPFRELLQAATASASIPLIFEARSIGYNGLLSAGAFDGGLSSMGICPNPTMLKCINPDILVSGGDIFCANSKMLMKEGWQEDDFVNGAERKKLTLTAGMHFVWNYLIWKGCNSSIQETKRKWEEMFNPPIQTKRMPIVRVFRNAGTRIDTAGKELPKPDLSLIGATEFREMFDSGKEYCDRECKQMETEYKRMWSWQTKKSIVRLPDDDVQRIVAAPAASILRF